MFNSPGGITPMSAKTYPKKKYKKTSMKLVYRVNINKII
tara:strand:+ start:683 stop:799 length:117 start_codon:yes stop_codon:yes gene_type:complete